MKNTFVENYLKEHNLVVLKMDEDRPWGAWYVLRETPEFDEKVFWIKPGAFLSLQYHGKPNHPGHSENGVALTEMALIIGKTDVSQFSLEEIYEKYIAELEVQVFQPGETFSTPAGVLHAYINPFDHDMHLTEIRTSQAPESSEIREANITRLFDTAMRGGIPDWPDFLKEKIRSTGLKNGN